MQSLNVGFKFERAELPFASEGYTINLHSQSEGFDSDFALHPKKKKQPRNFAQKFKGWEFTYMMYVINPKP